MSKLSLVLIGNDTLTRQCAEIARQADHRIVALVTRHPALRDWAAEQGVRCLAPGPDLAAQLSDQPCDWLLSIANLDVLPPDVLVLPTRGAVNLHDGPLPAYAGLNTPVWALLAGEVQHGISWHLIEGGIDEGDVIVRRTVPILDEDTALSLNTKCFAAALDSFPDVLAELAKPSPDREVQDLGQRQYFSGNARPAAGGRLDFSAPAGELVRLVRALDHGGYWNPLALPKFEARGQVWLARTAEIAPDPSDHPAGTVTEVTETTLCVATGDGVIGLSALATATGDPVATDQIARMGDVLPIATPQELEALTKTLAPLASKDPFWRARLNKITPIDLPSISALPEASGPVSAPVTLSTPTDPLRVQAGLAILVARLFSVDAIDLAFEIPPTSDGANGYICDWVPLRLTMNQSFGALTAALKDAKAQAQKAGSFACDLLARLPGAESVPQPILGLTDTPDQGRVGRSALTLTFDPTGQPVLLGDPARIEAAMLPLYAARLAHLLDHAQDDTACPDLPILPEAERQMILSTWNATEQPFAEDLCIHQAFEAQAAQTPEATALCFEDESLTYASLNARANQFAHQLNAMGISPGTIVGLHLPRSLDLMIAAFGILKAGAAYLPMDPSYPAERTRFFIENSQTPVIITTEDLAKALPATKAQVLILDATNLTGFPETTPEVLISGQDLAYVIYTSGSTGQPKGVMVEHRNVVNFFAGMDARIDTGEAGVWLAVTSLSFDISVLEVFWTLARGFKVVLASDNAHLRNVRPTSGKGMEFSLYYWGNDDGIGRDKYRTLLDGAKFADQHGFCAIWTPERHFHAFGGPYPNPSVTGAAVAAVTQNLGVRAGSCVSPLHHTARIAEEWAVIDNLTNGRTGLALASGWQPDDFILRPENTPPDNKPALSQAIADLRQLWAGEPVAFPRKDGSKLEVLTQPRPVSKALDLWLTTAGNPETWIEAGRYGCHVLTHLLGQTIEEVQQKISLYHEALREAGHNPDDFTVTLMLHTFIGHSRDEARVIAREPMKAYLRSAAGLIKQYAWAFPAFKRPENVDNAFDLDLGSLSGEELDAILDFAFERYFNDSGLFGTVEDALARVDEVRATGVTEIACLIDYGIDAGTVLDGLHRLAKVVASRADPPEQPEIAARIAQHHVSHLQCTPSMARLFLLNTETANALSGLEHLLIGGEGLPAQLVQDLTAQTDARLQNMYGPTETTIWSTMQPLMDVPHGVARLGTPIANTHTYVLDEAGAPVPIGMPGELYIGGAGVTRGYWARPELTAERFVPDPFKGGSARMYRTGDLVRWCADGKLAFLGRTDDQVKIRGYRIEPKEVEVVLDALPGIHQSVVVASDDASGATQLLAYVLAADTLDEEGAKAAMARTLPPHMVPGRIIRLDAFPMTPNKKVDRSALLTLAAKIAQKPQGASAPEAPPASGKVALDSKQAIKAIWRTALGVEEISDRDNFFDLGGHSLLAVQAHRDLRASLKLDSLSITDIFRYPTLGDLAQAIDAKQGRTTVPAADKQGLKRKNALATSESNAAQDIKARRRAMRAKRRGT